MPKKEYYEGYTYRPRIVIELDNDKKSQQLVRKAKSMASIEGKTIKQKMLELIEKWLRAEGVW